MLTVFANRVCILTQTFSINSPSHIYLTYPSYDLKIETNRIHPLFPYACYDHQPNSTLI